MGVCSINHSTKEAKYILRRRREKIKKWLILLCWLTMNTDSTTLWNMLAYLSREVLFAMRMSYARHTPRTVAPCSLHNMEAHAHVTDRRSCGRWWEISLLLQPSLWVHVTTRLTLASIGGHLLVRVLEQYNSSEIRKKTQASTSALPTTPDTCNANQVYWPCTSL